jgi:hypothetical protein
VAVPALMGVSRAQRGFAARRDCGVRTKRRGCFRPARRRGGPGQDNTGGSDDVRPLTGHIWGWFSEAVKGSARDAAVAAADARYGNGQATKFIHLLYHTHFSCSCTAQGLLVVFRQLDNRIAIY